MCQLLAIRAAGTRNRRGTWSTLYRSKKSRLLDSIHLRPGTRPGILLAPASRSSFAGSFPLLFRLFKTGPPWQRLVGGVGSGKPRQLFSRNRDRQRMEAEACIESNRRKEGGGDRRQRKWSWLCGAEGRIESEKRDAGRLGLVGTLVVTGFRVRIRKEGPLPCRHSECQTKSHLGRFQE